MRERERKKKREREMRWGVGEHDFNKRNIFKIDLYIFVIYYTYTFPHHHAREIMGWIIIDLRVLQTRVRNLQSENEHEQSEVAIYSIT